jgi:hypothetical protein
LDLPETVEACTMRSTCTYWEVDGAAELADPQQNLQADDGVGTAAAVARTQEPVSSQTDPRLTAGHLLHGTHTPDRGPLSGP